MKTINLLPKEEKVIDIKTTILNIVLILAIILSAITLLFSVLFYDINENLSMKLSEYENVNMKLQNYANKLKAYGQFEEKVANKSNLTNYIQKDEILWSEILYNLGELIPDDTYITNFEGGSRNLYSYLKEMPEMDSKEAGSKKITSFSIEGYSASYVDISGFIIEIKKIPGIGEVWIRNISRTQIPDVTVDVLSYTIETFWDLEPYLEEIKQQVEVYDESMPVEEKELEESMLEE